MMSVSPVIGVARILFGFVVVHDEIADAPVQRDKWEVAGHVIVHDSGSLVGKCSKAKYICD